MEECYAREVKINVEGDAKANNLWISWQSYEALTEKDQEDYMKVTETFQNLILLAKMLNITCIIVIIFKIHYETQRKNKKKDK